MKKSNISLMLSLIIAVSVLTSCGVTYDETDANADNIISNTEVSDISTVTSVITTTKLPETTINSTSKSDDLTEENITDDNNDNDEEVIYDPYNDIYESDTTEPPATLASTSAATTSVSVEMPKKTDNNKKSLKLIECDIKYDDAYFFNEGLCPYQDSKTGLWGYMDSNFDVAIKPNYYRAYCFSDGLAAVFNGEKWGFINPKGKTVIPFEYDSVDQKFRTDTCMYAKEASGFIDGYAVVEQDSMYPNNSIVINKKGEVVNTSQDEDESFIFNSSRFGDVTFVQRGGYTYICNEKLEGVYKSQVPGNYSDVPYGWFKFWENKRMLFHTNNLGVLETNSSAIIPYFVVDKKGNLVFDPQKCNNLSAAVFTDNSYIIQTQKSGIYRATVYNYKNEEIFGGNYAMITPVCKNGKATYYIGRYRDGESELLDNNGNIVNVDWMEDNVRLSIKYLTSYEDKYSDYAVVFNSSGDNAKIVNMSTLKLVCNIDKYLDYPTVDNENQSYGVILEYAPAFIYNGYIILKTIHDFSIYDLNGTELGSIDDSYGQYKDFDFQEINMKYGIIKTKNGFVKIK